jgi:hypothetical protein
MPEFLLEQYVSRADRAGVDRGAERARRAAEQLTREGTRVRHLRALFLPDEETCFHLYRAASVEAVRAAATRAGLSCDHIVEVVLAASGRARPLGLVDKERSSP